MKSIEIRGEDLQQKIFVSISGESVFISAMVPGGSCYMSIAPSEAQKMIEALQIAISRAKEAGYGWGKEVADELRREAIYDTGEDE